MTTTPRLSSAPTPWGDLVWRRWRGTGPDEVLWRGAQLEGLRLEPGRQVSYATELIVPRDVEGIGLPEVDELEITVNSLYRVELRVDDDTVLAYDGPRAAAPSPALAAAIAIRPGQRLAVELLIDPPDHQLMSSWVRLHVTTAALRERSTQRDLASARAELARTARPDLVRQVTVHFVGHAHVDMSWLWTSGDTEEVAIRDAETILRLLAEHPRMRFSSSQAALHEMIERRDPARFEEIRRRVAEGRWEPVCMTWVEADNHLTSATSLLRQARLASAHQLASFGTNAAVYMAPDNFGHSANMPAFVAAMGGLAYFHTRCVPSLGGPLPAYWWHGLDGSEVLAITAPSYNMVVSAAQLVASAAEAAHRGLGHALVVYGVGDHGGGPTRHDLALIDRLGAETDLPTARHSTFSDYVGALLDDSPSLPRIGGSSAPIFEGCYSSQVRSKQLVYRLDTLLDQTCTLAAMAGIATDSLAAAERAAAFDEFHDILPGTSIRAVYDEQQVRFDDAAALALDLRRDALDRLTVDADADELVVFNTLPWRRLDVVTVEVGGDDREVVLEQDDGTRSTGQVRRGLLRFLADLGPWGVTNFRVHSEGSAMPAIGVATVHGPGGPQRVILDIPEFTDPPYLAVRTEFFDLRIARASGVFVAMTDLRTGRELVGHGTRRPTDYQDAARPELGINVLQLAHERPHGMSAWSIAEVDQERALIAGARTEVSADGPVFAEVLTTHELDGATLAVTTRMFRELARIDVELEVDWRVPGGPTHGVTSLKTSSCLAGLHAAVTVDVPFGCQTLPADGSERVAVSWARVGDDHYGLATLTRGTHAHDALGSRLRSTLVRNSYSPDADSAHGQHRLEYALFPHVGSWSEAELPRVAACYSAPLFALAGRRSKGRNCLPEVVAEGVDVRVIGCTEDGSPSFVAWEQLGRRGNVALGAGRAMCLDPFAILTFSDRSSASE